MDHDKKSEGALLCAVRLLLDSTQKTALDIYKATGVAPNQQWAIRAGKTKNPGVNSIEALYVFLSGNQLEL